MHPVFSLPFVTSSFGEEVKFEVWVSSSQSDPQMLSHFQSSDHHPDLNFPGAQGVLFPEIPQWYCRVLEAGQEAVPQLLTHSPLASPSISSCVSELSPQLDLSAEGPMGPKTSLAVLPSGSSLTQMPRSGNLPDQVFQQDTGCTPVLDWPKPFASPPYGLLLSSS